MFDLRLVRSNFSARFLASPAVRVPNITNEPILSFAPGSKERKDVEKVSRERKGKVLCKKTNKLFLASPGTV